MMQKLNKDEEINLNAEWSIIFFKFLLTAYSNDPKSIEMFNGALKAIYAARERKDVRGMRMLINDVLEWYSYLRDDEKAELNKIFRKELGNEYLTINTFRDKIVKKVLKSKQILCDDDCYAVSSYVHDSDMQLKYPEKVGKLELVMSNYQSEELKNQ